MVLMMSSGGSGGLLSLHLTESCLLYAAKLQDERRLSRKRCSLPKSNKIVLDFRTQDL